MHVNRRPGVSRAVEIPQELQQLPIVRGGNAHARPAHGFMHPLVRRVEVKSQEMREGKIRNPVQNVVRSRRSRLKFRLNKPLKSCVSQQTPKFSRTM